MRDAGRVAVNLGEVRHHRLDDPGVGPRGRVVVEVDGGSRHGWGLYRPDHRRSRLTDEWGVVRHAIFQTLSCSFHFTSWTTPNQGNQATAEDRRSGDFRV